MKGPNVELENPDGMGFWRWLWLHWLATLGLDSQSICVMSRNKGVADYHDYHDSIEGVPDHLILLTCKRCGKQFTI